MNVNQRLLNGTRNALIVLFAAGILLPVFYSLSISFRPLSEVYSQPHLIPNHFTIQAYVSFFEKTGIKFLNSLLIATGVTVLTVSIAVPGAYVFARKDFPKRRFFFYAVVMTILVPPVMLVVPVTQIFAWINLRNTIFGTWFAVMITTTPIAIWILRDNFESLPANLEEAAQVYGCTQFEAFLRVVLPLAVPAVIAVGFLMFLYAWIDFLFTNLLTTAQTEPVIVFLYQQFNPARPTRFPFVLAGSAMIAAPPIILYTISQRYLEEALEFQ